MRPDSTSHAERVASSLVTLFRPLSPPAPPAAAPLMWVSARPLSLAFHTHAVASKGTQTQLAASGVQGDTTTAQPYWKACHGLRGCDSINPHALQPTRGRTHLPKSQGPAEPKVSHRRHQAVRVLRLCRQAGRRASRQQAGKQADRQASQHRTCCKTYTVHLCTGRYSAKLSPS